MVFQFVSATNVTIINLIIGWGHNAINFVILCKPTCVIDVHYIIYHVVATYIQL